MLLGLYLWQFESLSRLLSDHKLLGTVFFSNTEIAHFTCAGFGAGEFA